MGVASEEEEGVEALERMLLDNISSDDNDDDETPPSKKNKKNRKGLVSPRAYRRREGMQLRPRSQTARCSWLLKIDNNSVFTKS